ncbi:MAG: NADH-quinone oxidoreductase subunit J [bacterium]|nr:NADH-quinone oxidoreductase subunit J [bacterium]
MESIFFYSLAIISIAAALMVIISRNPVHSALFLILTFFCVAGLFALLNAHFLAAIQVLVYTGAIMVLFLFVIMLLNLKAESFDFEKLLNLKIFGVGAGAFFLFELLYFIIKSSSDAVSGPGVTDAVLQEGNTKAVGKLLFTEYLLPFEITSILLIVAIIGAVVLAKKKLEE